MFPIQVSAKNQRPCSRWVTNAKLSFEAVSGACVIRLLSVFRSLGRDYLMASPVTRRYTISVMNPAVVMA
jgi:hypothetical protein